MRLGFKGLDNKARRIEKVYVGVDNIARKCVKGYVGVNGVATLIYPVDQPIPTVTGHFVYDRNSHEAEISDYDPEMIEVIGTTQTSQAGRHTVTFKLKSPLYRWMDGTTTPKSSTWVIDKARVTPPTVTTKDYVYNGSLYTAVISNYDPYAIEVSGQTAINAGTHKVVLKLTNTNNYVWSDGSSADKSFPWVISPAKVAIPSVTGSYSYNGKAQSAVISAYDKTAIKVSGTTSAINAGSYAVKFNLTNTTNYRWTDNTITEKSKPWTIAKLTIAVPKVTSSLVYNGNEQTATVEKYNENLISEGGTRKGTPAGSYAVTFSLKDTTNYMWVGGSTSKQSVPWTIAKKPITIPTVSSNLRYTGNIQKPTITNLDTGAVTPTGSLDGKVVGTYKITFTLNDPKNTYWKGTNNDVTPKYGEWTIRKALLSVPWLTNTSYTYDGTDHAPTINYQNSNDKNLITVGGKYTVQKNAGTYTVTFNITPGQVAYYEWTTSTSTVSDVGQKSANWTIAPLVVTIPTVSANPTYNGTEQSPTLRNYNSSLINLVNETKKKDAGTYSIGFQLKNTNNYRWTDNSNTIKTASWKVLQRKVNPPLKYLSTYYTGYDKEPLDTDPFVQFVGGTTKEKVVGTYSVTFKVDGVNVIWADGAPSQRSVNWKILKTNIRIELIRYQSYYEGGESFGSGKYKAYNQNDEAIWWEDNAHITWSNGSTVLQETDILGPDQEFSIGHLYGYPIGTEFTIKIKYNNNNNHYSSETVSATNKSIQY